MMNGGATTAGPRRATSGSVFMTSDGSGSGKAAATFRKVDFYAKLPSELSEGSVTGGVLSIAVSFVFFLLLAMQVRWQPILKATLPVAGLSYYL